MDSDPFVQEICAQAFNAQPGHAIIGHVDESGKLHTEEIVVEDSENEDVR